MVNILSPLPCRTTRVAPTLLLLCCFLHSPSGFALSPEIELDRYLLAVKKHLMENNHSKANEYINRIKLLDADAPADFHYYEGKVQQHRKEFDTSRVSFEAYVKKAGKEGEFYLDALEQITVIEEHLLDKQARDKSLEKHVSMRADMLANMSEEKTDRQAYIDSLKKLYLTQSASKALIQHINSILKTTVFTGTRIKSDAKNQGVVYSVNVNSNNEIVTIKHDKRVKPAKITSEKINVYGVNPFIDHACDADQVRCWIKRPDGFNQWVLTSYDEKNAQELATAFSRLVHTLQMNK